jgi:ubiquitin-like domain-containing CTD phosphatase 1
MLHWVCVTPAGKKCLVLDIDYTLFDLNSSAEHPDELARPYLHEFLTACYEYYDIIIWSATNMKWVEVGTAETACGHMQQVAVFLRPAMQPSCVMNTQL